MTPSSMIPTPAAAPATSASPGPSTPATWLPRPPAAPPIYQRGRIRIIGDAPLLPGYIREARSKKGRYSRCEEQSEALVVRYTPSGESFQALLLDKKSWLGITWPNLKSSEWCDKKRYRASLAKLTSTGETRMKSSCGGDQGASQHVIWTIALNNELRVQYNEDNGTGHKLHTVLSALEPEIRFTRCLSTYLSKYEGTYEVRLVFEPL